MVPEYETDWCFPYLSELQSMGVISQLLPNLSPDSTHEEKLAFVKEFEVMFKRMVLLELPRFVKPEALILRSLPPSFFERSDTPFYMYHMDLFTCHVFDYPSASVACAFSAAKASRALSISFYAPTKLMLYVDTDLWSFTLRSDLTIDIRWRAILSTLHLFN